MKTLRIVGWRIATLMQQVGVHIDPELLQWPGASLIALLFVFRSMAARLLTKSAFMSIAK
jgi:hypothetical protein